MRKLLILFNLTLFLLAMSQSGKENYFPSSPEAHALIKYVDVPVNYSTGVVNYSIPIHTIKLKGITIPITLSYQNSGFKPSEVASNVGLGWDLNVGGKIIQNVIGKNDITSPNPYLPLPNDRDFILPKSGNTFMTVPGTSPYDLDSLRSSNTDYYIFSQMDEMQMDTQADLFYYSIPNKSGKFFFGNNNEVKQIPFGRETFLFKNIETGFEIIDTNGIKYIFDEFSENINSTYSYSPLQFLISNSSKSEYSYYLTKIITPSNDVVDFVYNTIKYNLINEKDYSRYYSSTTYGDTEKVTSYNSEITSKVLVKIIVNKNSDELNKNYQVEFLYNKFRKDIKGRAIETAPKTLDAIKIKFGQDVDVYNFDYGYFGLSGDFNENIFEGTDINGDTDYRLKLKSLQKNSDNAHLFNYYNEAAAYKFTTCKDHWGYFTNVCDKYTLNMLFGDLNLTAKTPHLEEGKVNVLKEIILPTKGKVEFFYELNDYFDPNFAQERIDWIPYSLYFNEEIFSGENEIREMFFTVPLNNMTTPMLEFLLYDGGVNTSNNNVIAEIYDDNNNIVNFESTGDGKQTTFYKGDLLIPGKTYKLQLKGNDNPENQLKYFKIMFLTKVIDSLGSKYVPVGGLRISDIKTEDSKNIITSHRIFDYKNDNSDFSGLLYEKPFYFDVFSIYIPWPGEVAPIDGYGLQSFSVQHSRMPADLFGFNGYHIYYQKVTETKINTVNLQEKIKTEKYFTFQDDLRYGDGTYFSKISYNWKRGLLTRINEFKGTDTIRKTMYSYKFLDTPAGKLSLAEPGFHLSNPTFPNEFHKRSIDINLIARNLNFYNIYGYQSSKLISAWYYMDKQIIEENQNGKTLTTTIDYNYNNSSHNQLTSQKTIFPDLSTSETLYSYAAEEANINMKEANMVGIPLVVENKKNSKTISKNRTIYSKNTTTSNLILPTSVLSYDLQSPTTAQTEVTYNQYDLKGNLQQYTTKSGVPTAIIWGYNQTQPIAKIEGATYAQVSALAAAIITASNTDNTTGTQVSEDALILALNTFRTASTLNGYQITTYSYDPLIGVRSITPPSGIREIYTYDTANRLQSVKDIGGKILKEYQYNYKQ